MLILDVREDAAKGAVLRGGTDLLSDARSCVILQRTFEDSFTRLQPLFHSSSSFW